LKDFLFKRKYFVKKRIVGELFSFEEKAVPSSKASNLKERHSPKELFEGELIRDTTFGVKKRRPPRTATSKRTLAKCFAFG
jgi:hypothetical protein